MSKLYGLLIGGLAFLAGIFKIFSMGKHSERNRQNAANAKAASQYQKAGTDALVDGLAKETEVRNEKVDPDSPRSRFD